MYIPNVVPHQIYFKYCYNLLCSYFFKACGFEILVSQAKSTTKDTPVDLTYDKRWHQYKTSLTNKGYFKVLTLNIFNYLKFCHSFFPLCLHIKLWIINRN